MKRWSLFLVLMLLLAACGGEAAEPVAEPAESNDGGQTAVVEQQDNIPPTPLPTVTPVPPPVITEEEALAVVEDGGEEEAAPAAPAPVIPWPADQFGYGIQIHGNATVGDPIPVMDSVKNQLGLQWVKIQIQWFLVRPDAETEQWFFYDGVIDEANNAGLNVMLSVVSAPPYLRSAGNHIGPPDDYQQMAIFLDELITRYDGKIAAIEVWNEQNLDREWQTANGVSPEDYVRFLEIANNAIKAADPNIIVITGAMAPTGGGDGIAWLDDFAWLDRALAAGMLDHADCLGAHHNGYNIPPDVAFDQTGGLAEAGTAVFRGPFDNPHHSWSFFTTLDTYADKIQAIDPNMKICVTEFGWASSEGYDEWPQGFEFARDNTLDEQAAFLVQAYNQMRDSGDVWLTFAFNYDFGNKGSGPTDDPVPYSIVDLNGVPRPAFGAIASMEKRP